MSVPPTIAGLMSGRPVCIRPEERLDIARALMVSCGIRHLPVEENGRLVGIVTGHDLLGVDLLRETTARQVMSAPVVTVPRDTSAEWALHTLTDHKISCLPVVEDGHTIGIVTVSDFIDCASGVLSANGDPPVSSLMSYRPIATVKPDDPLDLAIVLMKVEHVRHLPVMEGEHLVGMLSDHDLIRVLGEPEGEVSPERIQRARQLRVAEVMTARVVVVSPDESAARAGELLRRRRIGAAPVLRGRRLVGIVTACDFFQYLLSITPAQRGGEPVRRWPMLAHNESHNDRALRVVVGGLLLALFLGGHGTWWGGPCWWQGRA